MAERGESASRKLPHRLDRGDPVGRGGHGARPRREKARHRVERCGPRLVQVRHATGLTSEEYVRQKGWLAATLPFCPFHPEGGCGLARHGSYPRIWPAGCRIARYWCPLAGTTISLLPDFLCAGLTGSLAEVEAVVAAAEAAPTQEQASEALRPDIELPGALRWLGRRVRLVRAGLAAAIGLLPGLLAGCQPTVKSTRSALGAESVLVCLRAEAAPHLGALPPVLGFGPRPARRRSPKSSSPHDPGPDPPAGTR